MGQIESFFNSLSTSVKHKDALKASSSVAFQFIYDLFDGPLESQKVKMKLKAGLQSGFEPVTTCIRLVQLVQLSVQDAPYTLSYQFIRYT